MKEFEFNESAAIYNLKKREKAKAIEREELRKKLLDKAFNILRQEFNNRKVEVWLIGSINQQNQFSKRSDIDIVIKNYIGDRLELWTSLEKKIGCQIEIILYEECDFKDEIEKHGLKVL